MIKYKMFPKENTNNEEYLIFASHLSMIFVMNTLFNNKLPYKVLQGCYKGKQEISYMINARYDISNLGLIKQQECTMRLSPVQLDGLRSATLTYHKDRDVMRYIGKFVPVAQAEALASENYTCDPKTNIYYVTKK